MTILFIFFSIALVILIHEIGHFLVAKKLKVRVTKFSLGIGPEIIKKQIGETNYCLSAFPIGGEVRMAGENYFQPDYNAGTDEFYGKPWYQRIMIVAAGPAMNYSFAFIMFIFITLFWGKTDVDYQPVVGNVIVGKPAYKAGIKRNDKIFQINSKDISKWSQISEIVNNSKGKPLLIKILRDEKVFSLNVIPEFDRESKRFMIGIIVSTQTQKIETIKIGLIGSIGQSLKQIYFWSVTPLKYLFQKIIRLEAPKDISGPIGIFQVMSYAVKTGMENFLSLLAIISTSLGLINFLPIPILDGGHILFYLIEGIIRKPLNKKIILVANVIGFSILIFILLFATYQDIYRWKTGFWESFKK